MQTLVVVAVCCVLVVVGQDPQNFQQNFQQGYQQVAQQVSQQVPSSSPEAVQAVLLKLFDNTSVDPNVQDAINKYAAATDADSTINNLVNAKNAMMRNMPEKARNTLSDSFKKQQNNVQNFLENMQKAVEKSKTEQNQELFNHVNSALAALHSDGTLAQDMSTSTVCNDLQTLATNVPEAAGIIQKYFNYDPQTQSANCRQQLFGLMVSAQGGSGTPGELLQEMKSKLQSFANKVSNGMNNVANQVSNGVNNVANQMGQAARNFGESVSNTASNWQQQLQQG